MKIFSLILFVLCWFTSVQAQHGEPPVIAPFKKLDTYCTNDWWNDAAKAANNQKKMFLW
ncbi:hypothetical protein [Carboxylicivirga sp. M1479]|uniref:hypothetical protein n=1 Tax=Carboxylicivirga sp. M1479 TaxID=2594476 RepID=UPI00163D8EA6|nr:hypothetical protein [Carboxylicivirga sp. M1479]